MIGRWLSLESELQTNAQAHGQKKTNTQNEQKHRPKQVDKKADGWKHKHTEKKRSSWLAKNSEKSFGGGMEEPTEAECKKRKDEEGEEE